MLTLFIRVTVIPMLLPFIDARVAVQRTTFHQDFLEIEEHSIPNFSNIFITFLVLYEYRFPPQGDRDFHDKLYTSTVI